MWCRVWSPPEADDSSQMAACEMLFLPLTCKVFLGVTVSTGMHSIAVTPGKKAPIGCYTQRVQGLAGFRCGCVGPGSSHLSTSPHLDPMHWLPSPALLMARAVPTLPSSKFHCFQQKSFSSLIADSCVQWPL